MLAKEITYTDFAGVERTETFWFNLTEAELTEWSMSEEGGLQGILQKIIEEKSIPKVIMYFKTMILKAYGEKSNDNRFFEKSEAISKRFESSPAYDVLFMELYQDGTKANAFFKGIVPSKYREQIEKAEKEETNRIADAKAKANIAALPVNANT